MWEREQRGGEEWRGVEEWRVEAAANWQTSWGGLEVVEESDGTAALDCKPRATQTIGAMRHADLGNSSRERTS